MKKLIRIRAKSELQVITECFKIWSKIEPGSKL